jgi:hypothetical protein
MSILYGTVESWDGSVGIVTRVRTGQRSNLLRYPLRARVSPPKSLDRPGAHPASCPSGVGGCNSAVALIWPLTWLRMSGDVLPLPHTPLRHSHRQHLTFIRYRYVFVCNCWTSLCGVFTLGHCELACKVVMAETSSALTSGLGAFV